MLLAAIAAAAPPPVAPDARFALALYCNPTCSDDVATTLDEALATIDAEDGFPGDASRPMRVMGLAGPEFGVPDAAYVEGFGEGVEDAEKLAGSQQVLLAWFASPRERARETLGVAHAAFAEAARAAGGWVEDLDTGSVYGVGAWEGLDPEGPVEDWFSIDDDPMDAAAPEGPVRLVTRGLRRFGGYELVVEDVDPEAGADVSYVINAVGARAVEEGTLGETLALDTPEVHGTASFAVAERREDDPADPVLRLRFEGEIDVALDEPVAAAAPAVPPAPAAPAAPQVASTAPVAPPVAPSGPRTLQEARAEVQRRLQALKPVFDAGLPPGDLLAVEAPFRTSRGSTEYLWVEVNAWTGSSIAGVVGVDPGDVPGLRKGSQVAVRQSEVYDYVVKHADGSREGRLTRPFR